MLRPTDPDRDGPALHAIFGDEASCRYLPRPAFTTVAETIRQLRAWVGPENPHDYVVVEAPDGPAVGRVALIPRGEGVFEAAVMVCPQATGRGLATAALSELVAVGFREGARRIFADIDPDNAACLRTFEKVGFQREGRLRATWVTHIGVRDSVIMSRLATDP